MGKETMIEIGKERILKDNIKAYYIVSNQETEQERQDRKDAAKMFKGYTGGMKSGVLGIVPGTLALCITANPVIGAGAIVAGGVIGYVSGSKKGSKKAEKKFENNIKNASLDHSVLIIKTKKGANKSYSADSCGFDIYEKCKELDEIFGVRKSID